MIKKNNYMRAENLMIGDWVIDEYTNRPMRIEGVNKMMGSGLSPIPITAEILEKNGFEEKEYFDQNGKVYCMFFERGYVSLEFVQYILLDCYKDGSNFIKMEIKYVHELQHVLRLCGLNELVDNFKI